MILRFISITELFLEPSDNVYRGTGDLAYLNGQIRIGFVRGNEILEKSDGIPLDGKILTGICVIAAGDSVREAARKSVKKTKIHPIQPNAMIVSTFTDSFWNGTFWKRFSYVFTNLDQFLHKILSGWFGVRYGHRGIQTLKINCKCNLLGSWNKYGAIRSRVSHIAWCWCRWKCRLS